MIGYWCAHYRELHSFVVSSEGRARRVSGRQGGKWRRKGNRSIAFLLNVLKIVRLPPCSILGKKKKKRKKEKKEEERNYKARCITGMMNDPQVAPCKRYSLSIYKELPSRRQSFLPIESRHTNNLEYRVFRRAEIYTRRCFYWREKACLFFIGEVFGK